MEFIKFLGVSSIVTLVGSYLSYKQAIKVAKEEYKKEIDGIKEDYKGKIDLIKVELEKQKELYKSNKEVDIQIEVLSDLFKNQEMQKHICNEMVKRLNAQNRKRRR